MRKAAGGVVGAVAMTAALGVVVVASLGGCGDRDGIGRAAAPGGATVPVTAPVLSPATPPATTPVTAPSPTPSQPPVSSPSPATTPVTTPSPVGTPSPVTTSPSGSPASEPPSTGTLPLKLGDEGQAVRDLQRKLADLRYDPGAVDGVFGPTTRFAVYAFQKVNGLTVDGLAGSSTLAALDRPRSPAVLVPDGGPNRVEVNLKLQLVTVYSGGKLALISHTSTGSGKPYTVDGERQIASTPPGNFKTTWRVDGWRTSRLGQLYNPVYFNGGIAVHGYPSVPLYPASHGCVRIPMHTAEIFPTLVGTGEPVYVRGAA